jgi:two-component system sensor histidine kinase YesM
MKWLWRKFKDAKIRHKIIIMFFIIGVIPMVFLGDYSYTAVKKLLIEQEKSNMQDYLTQAVMSVDNQIQIYNNLSEYISYNDSLAQVLTYSYDNYYEMYEQYTKVVDPMLSSVKYFNQGVEQLTIYTSNPKLEKHDVTIDVMQEIQNKYWYLDLLKSDSTTINWYVAKSDKLAFSARRMPAIQNAGSSAVLYIEVDYDKLFESFKDMSSDLYGVYVVDEKNQLLYEKRMYEKQSEQRVPKVIDIKKNNPICQEYTIVGENTISGWKVWFYKPNQVINASVVSLVVAILIVMVVCIVFSLIGASVFSKIMVTDIEKLTKNMEAVEQGNMEIMVTSDSADEVGNLIRGFGNMINRINQLINEVYVGKISQKESEMRALQAQINPHFLYNSLSLINWKALETNQTDISRLTLLLSTFYRTALNRGKNVLSIRDEISNMNSYLEIQLMMHENSFSVVRDIDEDILEFQTLNLILQPLIENAIDHGIDMKEEENGVITIGGHKDGNHILLSVEDNGVGMDEETAKSILSKESKGYGVRNVNERIMLYYGEAYHLTVESKLGEGTKITVRIPQIKM